MDNKAIKEKILYNAVNIALESSYNKISKAIKEHKSWENVWNNLKKSEKLNVSPEKEWHKMEKLKVKLILANENSYPKLLKEIPYPPLGLYILGDGAEDYSPSIAIVGTRKADQYGENLSKTFSCNMSKEGFSIISGLAIGIDTYAHIGAIEAKGNTIAVLGGGINKLYPSVNKSLKDAIVKNNGAILSEYPIDSPSMPHHFIERNRIISGLSNGILVIEAPEHSGSLSTARFALEQNRDVFVVPGPIENKNFKGSNQLIKSGAQLITNYKEMIESLGFQTNNPPGRNKNNNTPYSKEEKIILDAIGKIGEPIDIDKIIKITNLKTQIVSRSLSFLIVKNIVKEENSKYSLK